MQNYFQLHAGHARARLRALVMRTFLMIGLGTTMITASILGLIILLQGLVHSLMSLFPGREWAAELIVGAATLAAVTAAILWSLHLLHRTVLTKTRKRYARRSFTNVD